MYLIHFNKYIFYGIYKLNKDELIDIDTRFIVFWHYANK